MRGVCALIVLALLPGPPPASDGEEAPLPDCPILLEAGLALPEAVTSGAAKWLTEGALIGVRQRDCEELHLADVAVSLGEAAGGLVPLRVRGKIENHSRRDLDIVLVVDLLREGARLTASAKEELEVEEDESSGWKVTLKAPSDLIRSTPPPRLRISLQRQ